MKRINHVDAICHLRDVYLHDSQIYFVEVSRLDPLQQTRHFHSPIPINK